MKVDIHQMKVKMEVTDVEVLVTGAVEEAEVLLKQAQMVLVQQVVKVVMENFL
jgi:hypothetical protein